MRLHLKIKPMKFMKALSVVLATWTMCVSPLAQGAEAANAQKQAINDFIKETGLTKKMTVGEYWQGVRQVYPLALRTQLDHWVSLNHNEMMPTVEASSFKDAQGKEQFRVNLTKDGEVVTLTFAGDKYSVNGVSFSRSEIAGYKSFDQMAEKIAKNDALVKKDLAKATTTTLSKDFILSYKEFQRLTARQKAEYFVRLRLAMEAAQKVYTVFNGTQAMNDYNKAHEWAYHLLFGQDAEAAGLAGQPCVVAGYLSVYGENNSCGGAKQGAVDLAQKMSANSASCSGGGVACNPMVYGFDPSNGDAPFCIARSELKYATSICNKRSPIETAQDKARIIESYLRKVPGKDGKTQNIKLTLDDKGQVTSAEQYKQISSYFDDLKGFVGSAIDKCDTAPLQNIEKKRDDQQSACDNIRVRAFSLQAFVAAPQPTVALLPPPAPQPKACEAPKVDDGKGGCTCPDGTHAAGGGGGHHAKAAPAADDASATSGTLGAPPLPNQADSDSGKCVSDKKAVLAGAKVTPPAQSSWWDNNKVWLLALGAAIIGGGIYWWYRNRHSGSTTSTVTTPTQVLPTTPYPPPTTTTVTPVTTSTGTGVSGGTTTTTTTTTPVTTEGGSGTTSAVSGGISREGVR